MRLLLDTHIFLWAFAGNRKLKAAVRRQMLAADEIFVYAASNCRSAPRSLRPPAGRTGAERTARVTYCGRGTGAI